MSPLNEEEILEATVDFATALEAAAVGFKQRISQIYGVGKLKEDAFLSLKGWSKSQGEKLGDFEFTTREANSDSTAFNHAYNILKANDATIKNHFGEKGWRYWYWVWRERPDTIYRKLREGKEPAPAEEAAGPGIEAMESKFPEDLARKCKSMKEILFDFDEFKRKVSTDSPIHHSCMTGFADKQHITYMLKFRVYGVSNQGGHIIIFETERDLDTLSKEFAEKWKNYEDHYSRLDAAVKDTIEELHKAYAIPVGSTPGRLEP